MEIKNRQILVSGASRGIGRAFSMMCAQNGASLHLIVRKEEADLKAELLVQGAKAVTFWLADLSDRESLEKVAAQLKNVQIDIVFNNAGMLTGGLLEKQDLSEIHQMLFVNINSLIHLTHILLPGMLERKRGLIINNSSVSAYMHFPCASTYAASKAAVAAFTDCLRVELKDTGVRTLLLITPGIKTKMFDDIDKLYGPNMQVPKSSISTNQYAEMIKEAIIEDLEILKPAGFTGLGLKVARYLPAVFEAQTKRFFKR